MHEAIDMTLIIDHGGRGTMWCMKYHCVQTYWRNASYAVVDTVFYVQLSQGDSPCTWPASQSLQVVRLHIDTDTACQGRGVGGG